MSCDLRWDQTCGELSNGEPCKAPGNEHGGICSAHWRSLQPEQRAALTWAAEATTVREPGRWSRLPMPTEVADILLEVNGMLGD